MEQSEENQDIFEASHFDIPAPSITSPSTSPSDRIKSAAGSNEKAHPKRGRL